jgi:hypothetical protein
VRALSQFLLYIFLLFPLHIAWSQVFIYTGMVCESRVEAVSDTSTVALRVVGGDEKGTQCLGVQLGRPVPGGYKYDDLALQVGESRICDSKMWPRVQRESDLRMTALARTRSNCKRQTHLLVREDVT